RTKEDRWMAEQSTLGFGNAPGTRSDFPSICIAFAMPLRLSGRSAIQRTCEEQRIFLAIPHLEQPKSTMSWRSRASPAGHLLGPSRVTNNGGSCGVRPMIVRTLSRNRAPARAQIYET